MKSAEDFAITIDHEAHEPGKWATRGPALSALIRARDREIVEDVIRIFDNHSAYDPHGVKHEDGSQDGIVKCTDALRVELERYRGNLGR